MHVRILCCDNHKVFVLPPKPAIAVLLPDGRCLVSARSGDHEIRAAVRRLLSQEPAPPSTPQ